MVFTLEIDGWNQGIRFSSAHLLPGHKKCGVLHGHTYAIHAKCYGDKDEQGFLIDFATVKSSLKIIAGQLDHSVLIPKNNMYVKVKDNQIYIEFDDKKYVFPKEDCVFLPMKNVTAENLTGFILDELVKKIDLPSNIEKVEIGVSEGVGQSAWSEKILG